MISVEIKKKGGARCCPLEFVVYLEFLATSKVVILNLSFPLIYNMSHFMIICVVLMIMSE